MSNFKATNGIRIQIIQDHDGKRYLQGFRPRFGSGPNNEVTEATASADGIAALREFFDRPAWHEAQILTWENGAHLPQIAQRDMSPAALGWRFARDEADGFWLSEKQLAAEIGDAPVTVWRAS